MPGGWGRRAAGQGERKLEDDELFKQIGGQLEASNFDYTQWQRRSPMKTPARRAVPLPSRHTGDADRPATVKTGFTVSTLSHRRTGSACSSTCRHPWTKKEAPRDTAADRERAERIKILQLRIKTRKQTIQEYRRRKAELLEENIKLRQDIESDEGNAHHQVKGLLRKYEKFRGGIINLNEQFGQELSDAQKDIEESSKVIDEDLKALEKDVLEVDGKLKQKQDELYVLMNYKDKEYPVKALRISDLHKEIEQLKVTNEEDESELKHIVETEIDKFRKEQQRVKRNITEKVTQEAIDLMHPSIKELALQNMVMQKEMEFHQKEIEELDEVNHQLEQEIRSLRTDPKTNIRLQLFPEFYPPREKCTPDMDVILDIPTQQWLPI